MATLSEHPAANIRTGDLPSRVPIELDRLSHSYGDRLALDNLSFAVRPAEIFGLLGPNGSGKTTLFRILSTLMVPTGGAARIEGFDVAREPNRARQQTGIVFQARSLDLKLTVAENLKHQGHLYGLRGVRPHPPQPGSAEPGRFERPGQRLRGNPFRRHAAAGGACQGPHPLPSGAPVGRAVDRARSGARRDMWQYLRMLRDQEEVSILVTTHLMEEAEIATGWLF